MRPPRLRCTLFPLIYPPHLLVLPATLGLHLFWQTYPYFRALYVISVRRTKSLPTASFRFHLTMNTLAVQLYTSSLPRCVRDLHPLERAHGARTNYSPGLGPGLPVFCLVDIFFSGFMHVFSFFLPVPSLLLLLLPVLPTGSVHTASDSNHLLLLLVESPAVPVRLPSDPHL